MPSEKGSRRIARIGRAFGCQVRLKVLSLRAATEPIAHRIASAERVCEYVTCSTTDQSLENQISRLAETGCELFFEEKTSGAVKKRPQLEKLLGQLRKDDVVVITKLDRLARSTADLLRIAEVLKEKTRDYNPLMSLGQTQRRPPEKGPNGSKGE